MPKMLFVSAVLVLLMQAPAVFSHPPEGPSGRMVQNAVPALQAEVKRLEKEVAHATDLAEDLAVARARLAAAEGKPKAAAAAWRKILVAREEREKLLDQIFATWKTISDWRAPAIRLGPLAEARCGLAEAEGDRAVLAKELPKVIAYHEAVLAQLRKPAEAKACTPEEVEQGEKAHLKELRDARQRLDAVKRR
jgi:hypothetical protein